MFAPLGAWNPSDRLWRLASTMTSRTHLFRNPAASPNTYCEFAEEEHTSIRYALTVLDFLADVASSARVVALTRRRLKFNCVATAAPYCMALLTPAQLRMASTRRAAAFASAASEAKIAWISEAKESTTNAAWASAWAGLSSRTAQSSRACRNLPKAPHWQCARRQL